MNEKIIRQMTKEEALTVGADYAAEEIRKLLGPRFLLGPFAGWRWMRVFTSAI